MRGRHILFSLVVIMLASIVYAESSVFKIETSVNPLFVLEEIRETPSLLYFAAGKYYFREGKYDQALEMFGKASILKPDFAPAYHNKGVVYFAMHDTQNAVVEFENSISADSSYVKGYYSLGILYFQLKDFDESISYFTSAVEMASDDPNLHFDLGQAYVARFRLAEEEGVEDYEDLKSALVHLKVAQEKGYTPPYLEKNIEILQSILDAREILIS